MPLRDYLDRIQNVLGRFQTTIAVRTADFHTEVRPAQQALVFGRVTFRDGSVLKFREYLDGGTDQVEKLMYSYHYQQANEERVFRYDNAAHRPALPYIHHRHDSVGNIAQTVCPDLENILLEIIDLTAGEI